MSTRRYREKEIIIYPEYLDSVLTRSMGRRLPKDKLIPKPSIDEIFRAAEELGLNPIKEEKNYPRDWYSRRGRIIVDKISSKRATLRMISDKLAEIRKEKTKKS